MRTHRNGSRGPVALPSARKEHEEEYRVRFYVLLLLVINLAACYVWLRKKLLPSRRKLVKAELREAIRAAAGRSPTRDVRVLSLAAGSAQMVIELMAELTRESIPVRALLIDREVTALHYARRLARRIGIASQFATVRGDVFRFGGLIGDFRPDIVEMLGLLEHVNDENAVSLFREIWEHLNPGGWFIVSQVHPSPELFFISQVVNWTGIYRTTEEFRRLFDQTRFASTTIVHEDLGGQCFAIARKLEASG